MARWRLTAPHYLNVPGTEWEQKETDRVTGKQARKVYPVCLHLDPKLPADHNYPDEIIVCFAGRGQPRDIIFEGKPTPEMEPLDDEAERISEAESKHWIHPIDSLPAAGSFGDALISRLERMLTADSSKPAADPTTAELLRQVRDLNEQVAMLSARVVEPPIEEPLEDIMPTPVELAVAEKRAARRA